MNRCFVFPGQGSQVVGMAKEFYDNFGYTRIFFEKANDILQRDIKKIMFEGPEELLRETENSQPAIMLASAIILEVIKKESGKTIDELCSFVAGHSLGEYSALYACESVDLENCLKLLDVRGKSFAEAGRKNIGTMLALVGATIEQVHEVVKKSRFDGEVLQVANDNTVGQVVLSGSVNSIKKAIEVSGELGIKKAVELNVSGAFHSELMKSALGNMKSILDKTDFAEPKVGFVANFTASKTNGNEIKENLLNQITGRVRWRETMIYMANNGADTFVEIGIGKVLATMVGRTCPSVKVLSVNSIDTLKEFIQLLTN